VGLLQELEVTGSIVEVVMGHRISAVLLHSAYDDKIARAFGLRPITLTQGITLFPLHAGYCDDMSERLGIGGDVSDRPRLNDRVVHHLVRRIAPEPLFAVIETNYFGGAGTQAAAVYRGAEEVMAPAASAFGPINEALRHLGVQASPGLDEFDTVGLGRFRSFDPYDP
jgi:hypothetical protein